RQLGAIHLKHTRRVAAQSAPTIRNDREFRLLFRDGGESSEYRTGDDASVCDVGLLQHDDRVHRVTQGVHGRAEPLGDALRRGSPVLEFQPAQLPRRLIWLKDQRLAVAEGAAFGSLKEMLAIHARERTKRAQPFVAIAVFTTKPDREDLSHAE